MAIGQTWFKVASYFDDTIAVFKVLMWGCQAGINSHSGEAGLIRMFAAQQPPNAFVSASQAVEQLVQSIATPLCIIAIALIGFSALSGRLPIRRGAMAIVGCFVLLGSVQISQALLQLADAAPSTSAARQVKSGLR